MSSDRSKPKAPRPKALICKPGPAAVLDLCLIRLSEEADVEHVATLAEGMRRCMEGGIDTLIVNLFSFSARELTALTLFRQLRPEQSVIAVTGSEMATAYLGAEIADEVFVLSVPGRVAESMSFQPRA